MDTEASRIDAVTDAVHKFGDAWAKGDLATLDQLLSPTYTHTDLFGALHDRASWLGYVAKRIGRDSKIVFDDVQVRTLGEEVAIVTGINTLTGPGVLSAADAGDTTIRFTQVLVRRDGRWLREAFQATPVSAKGHAE